MPQIAILLFIAAAIIVVIVVWAAGKWFRSEYSPIKYVKALLYSEVPFQVVSHLSLSEAERRLRNEVSRFAVPFIMSQRLIGSVKGRTLNIGLHRPFVSNSFAPIFVGSIGRVDGQTRVQGVFRFHKFVRVFMMFWFGFIIFWSAIGIPSGLIMLAAGQIEGAMFVLVPFIMFGFGIGLVKFGLRLGATNQSLIQEKIIETIGGVVTPS